MEPGHYAYYPMASLVAGLSFPAFALCIPPFIWHFGQKNIAVWSLILWLMILNFLQFINALIWPGDDISAWYNGSGLCDVEVTLTTMSSVALAACCTMMMRKLAKVMDTRNMTVTQSRSSKRREKLLEAFWCWGYPIIFQFVYRIVQNHRYYIYAISGCVAPQSESWVSIVLSSMWPAITICFAAFYAGVLLCRLHRYRREFYNLINARNTTKPRFIRLFLLAMITMLLLVPLGFYILWLNAVNIREGFSWKAVHAPGWSAITPDLMGTSNGTVRKDVWPRIAGGYVAFAVFGTGTDATNTYKKMLCTIGFGKIFPSLYNVSESSGPSTPSQVTFTSGLYSSVSNKAKSIFSRNSSVSTAVPAGTRNDSVALAATFPTTPRSGSFHHVSTNDPILVHPDAPKSKSFLTKLFTRRNQQPILPLFTNMSAGSATATEKLSPTDTCSSGFHAKAWASDSPTSATAPDHGDDQGVHVVHEVRQDSHEKLHMTHKEHA